MPTCDQSEPSGLTIYERVRLRLRETRLDRGLTVREVALAAGMDPSTLSRLESGRRRITLDHLPALARALAVQADDLLAAPPSPEQRTGIVPRRWNGMTVWALSQRQGHDSQTFKIRMPRERNEPEMRSHRGQQWCFVLSGRLLLILEDQEHIIQPGEVVSFDTGKPHWAGVVAEPVELLAISAVGGLNIHPAG